jgi:biotin-(acetyl-CoA carboxylase) ligase
MLGSIYYYDYVSNTNNEAKNLAEKYKITSGLVIADCQKHG